MLTNIIQCQAGFTIHQDLARHCVLLAGGGNVPIIERERQIRRLTPKECFRLQGWSDEDYEKAKFVNSDTQLYKQAGNGVTVNVIYEIAKKFEESL